MRPWRNYLMGHIIYFKNVVASVHCYPSDAYVVRKHIVMIGKSRKYRDYKSYLLESPKVVNTSKTMSSNINVWIIALRFSNTFLFSVEFWVMLLATLFVCAVSLRMLVWRGFPLTSLRLLIFSYSYLFYVVKSVHNACFSISLRFLLLNQSHFNSCHSPYSNSLLICKYLNLKSL